MSPNVLLLLGCANPPSLPVDEQPVETGLPADSGEERVPEVREPVINELMASNRSTVADPGGRFVDWVELYNPGEEDLALEGWSLVSGEEAQLLDGLALPAGGHLLLWADRSPELGPEHLGLGLGKDGDELALLAPGGRVVDTVDFPRQAPDISALRVEDGGATWQLSATPSPGAPNLESPWAVGEGEELGGDCSLDTPLEDRNFLEGDRVLLSLECTGELGLGQVDVVPLWLPEGGALDEELAFSWDTGPASGGRIELLIATRSRGAPERIPEANRVHFWVADNPANPDNVPVDPLTYTEEWGLPVFHVQTQGSLSQDYVDADIAWQGRSHPAQIKIRGASSASYPKNSYTLAFDSPEIEVPGWPESRDRVVLVTSFDDNSYVRQKLVFDQWMAMADYWGEQRLTPRSFFTVVYLDGVYHGLYTAVDHVDNEFVEQMGFAREGNLYKSVNHEANFYLTGTNGASKGNLASGYEKKQGEPVDDFGDLQALVAFTGGADVATLLAEAEQWISLDEFMDWFLLVAYCLGEDSAGKNAYLYNDPTQSTRFRFAPWDFNHAWGQNWYTARVASGRVNDYSWNNRVFWAIQQDPDSKAALLDRFAQMREDGPFAPEWLVDQVDGYYAAIDRSAQRDWEKWEDQYRSFGRWSSARTSANDWTSYAEEKAYLYRWLEERASVYEGLVPR